MFQSVLFISFCCLSAFYVLLNIIMLTPCISLLMILPNDKRIPHERIYTCKLQSSIHCTVCIFCSLCLIIPIVNWTFYLSLFQAANSSVHVATLTWRGKQRKAKNFVQMFFSVDYVLGRFTRQGSSRWSFSREIVRAELVLGGFITQNSTEDSEITVKLSSISTKLSCTCILLVFKEAVNCITTLQLQN